MNNNYPDKQKLVDAIVESSGGKIDKEKLQNAVSGGNAAALLSMLGNKERQQILDAMSGGNADNLMQNPQIKSLLKNFFKDGG